MEETIPTFFKIFLLSIKKQLPTYIMSNEYFTIIIDDKFLIFKLNRYVYVLKRYKM